MTTKPSYLLLDDKQTLHIVAIDCQFNQNNSESLISPTLQSKDVIWRRIDAVLKFNQNFYFNHAI